MIGKRFFAIFPKESLRELLTEFGIDPGACYPELIGSENSDRNRVTRDDELKLLKRTYASVFANQRRQDIPMSKWNEFGKRLDPQKFDSF